MTSLGDRLGHVGARLRPGAGGFFSWWGRELASWLPLRLRQVLGFDRGRLLLQSDGDAVQLRLQQGDDVRDLARLPMLADVVQGADGAAGASVHSSIDVADPLARLLSAPVAELPRWLLLPAASGLRRRLTLPAAAGDRLRDVVAFEVDRQTPFSADAVAFDARVVGRHDDGRLDAELVAVPRHVLNPRLAALGSLSATLAGIDLASENGVPLGVNLLPVSQRRRHRDPWRYWNLALVAVALVAIAATLWQLLDNRRAAAESFAARISADAPAGRRAAAQRQQLASLLGGQVFLDQARAGRPTAVEVFDELSRRLPDGTYLEKLSIDDDRLTLIGLSAEAPALIGRLQGSGLWSSPALAGALQPDPSSDRDRFTLVANLTAPKPETKEAASGTTRPSR